MIGSKWRYSLPWGANIYYDYFGVLASLSRWLLFGSIVTAGLGWQQRLKRDNTESTKRQAKQTWWHIRERNIKKICLCVYISFVANYLTNILIRYCLMCFDARMVHGMDSLIFILYHHISKNTEKQQWRPKHWCSRDYWRKGQSKARAIGNQGFNFYPLHSGGYEMQWSVLTQMPHHILVLSCNTWLSVYVTRAMSILQVLQVVRSWRWPAHPWVFQENGGLKTQRCNLRRFVSILQLHGSTVLCCVSRDSGKLVLGPGTTATLKRDLTKKSFFGMLVKVNADNKFST